MELTAKISWVSLALIHASPAFAAFAPQLLQRLYSVDSGGDLALLLQHRGVLFLALLVATLFALFEPSARRLATVVLGISMLGFLILYLRAGLPDGALRTIALADLVGLVPLAFVSYAAWLKPGL